MTKFEDFRMESWCGILLRDRGILVVRGQIDFKISPEVLKYFYQKNFPNMNTPFSEDGRRVRL